MLELSIVDITAGGSGPDPLPLYLGVTVKARLIAIVMTALSGRCACSALAPTPSYRLVGE